MPAAPMTSAARLISNPNFKSGWGAVLTPKTNEVIRSVKKEADGMYRLQTARDRPISATSIYTALFWEARNFRKPSIVFTPAVDDELQLFSEEAFTRYLNLCVTVASRYGLFTYRYRTSG